MTKVSIIGLGYVGLPLFLAATKNKELNVVGIEINKEKVEKIKNKICPIDDELAKKELKELDIKVSSNTDEIKDSDIIVVCVPTPVDEERTPDFSYLKSAAKAIVPHMKKGQLIIFESTVNPGVCEEVILPILEESNLKRGVDFDLAHCPERIDPGNSKYNVYNIARNVGSTSLEGTRKAAKFYKSFLDVEVNEMSSLKTAEATKIVENTFRDINIAYVNELAKCFDVLDIDILEVIKGASNKPFAFMPHYPSCGVGGHCIPVDPYYLIEKAKNAGFDHKFLRMAREVNNSMPEYTITKLAFALNEIQKTIKGTKIGILGLSYKANVGDLRESPALEIVKQLEKLGAIILKNDPYVKSDSIDEILKECDALILATNHREYEKIEDWKNIKVIVDGKNYLDSNKIKEKGILYRGIGRN